MNGCMELMYGPLQIWADAVCINQNDLEERSSQVSMMCDIYKDAQQCQIWLSTAEDINNFPDAGPVSIPSCSLL